ncbi:hypothetical protein [Rhizobium paknamense]|uniref:Uncharacterized protein n=1 Tax=Rhizobium paknamense TaxID=1206817 RepID=A0ABU0IJN4_9HYPH|nr:hypothetical protein [Rhizobium paknamense]MDQ0458473.1 hypothetical protein [Rhizobium paknamense]
MPLLLGIPLVEWLLGGTALGAAGWLYYRPGGTKDQLVNALSKPSPVQMSEHADEAASTDLDQGVATDTCSTCFPPECLDAVAKVKEALYRNKRLPGADGGQHGYLNRMVEQMCGKSGPGTDSWRNHITQLVGEQKKISDGMRDLRTAKCPIEQLLSRDERLAINNIVGGGNGWSPQTIPWKGPNHPDCFNFGEKISSGRLSDFLNVIRPQ